jgi:3-oxoacid CoA-transferase subunit A
MIYITGDTHGRFEHIEYFCDKNKTTKDNDIMIILGDAGINYYGGKKDLWLKQYLAKVPITFFLIRGNHENNPENINTYKQTEFANNIVLYEPEFPNLLFALDGRMYRLAEKTIWVMGGAYSVDKWYRLEKKWKWFADEQPSELHKDKGIKTLNQVEWKVDYVMTHTCPINYIPKETFLPFIDQSTVDYSTEEWLQTVENKLDYKVWFCGHYHTNKWADKIRMLYNDIIIL